MMQSKKDFDESINEVVYLNNIAQKDADNDKIFFKVIILLLCAKLEKFVKDSTNEYISLLLSMNLTKEALPPLFVNEVIKNEIQIISEKTVERYIVNERDKERSKVFSLIWDPKFILKNLEKEDFVVSISNNGTTVFKDTYKKIGFPDIISNLSDYKQETDIGGLSTFTAYSVTENINKVIKLRHEIIHDDATPSITKNDIDLYVAIFKNFVEQIDYVLTQKIHEYQS